MRKNLFATLLVALSMCLNACAKDQVITVNQLPAEAKTFIQTYFALDSVSFVMQEREGLTTEYEVRFVSGDKVEFDGKGALKKVDCGQRAVPAALLPEAVRTYVSKQFPNAFITEWGKDDRRWKAELNNGLELEFNSKYEFVRIDD